MFNYEIDINDFHPLLKKEFQKFEPKLIKLEKQFTKRHNYLTKKLNNATNSQEKLSRISNWEAKVATNKYRYYLKINKYLQFFAKNNAYAKEEQPNNIPSKWHNQDLNLHGVNFFYTHDAHHPKHVLKNLNFAFSASQISVIMGTTGSRKIYFNSTFKRFKYTYNWIYS